MCCKPAPPQALQQRPWTAKHFSLPCKSVPTKENALGEGCGKRVLGFWGAAFTLESLHKGFVLLNGRGSNWGGGAMSLQMRGRGLRDAAAAAAPLSGTSRHAVRPNVSRVCRNEPQENLGTLGGAEGSRKGSRAPAKGCSGVRGCRPGVPGAASPLWGWLSAGGTQLRVGPTLPATSSVCHFLSQPSLC